MRRLRRGAESAAGAGPGTSCATRATPGPRRTSSSAPAARGRAPIPSQSRARSCDTRSSSCTGRSTTSSSPRRCSPRTRTHAASPGTSPASSPRPAAAPTRSRAALRVPGGVRRRHRRRNLREPRDRRDAARGPAPGARERATARALDVLARVGGPRCCAERKLLGSSSSRWSASRAEHLGVRLARPGRARAARRPLKQECLAARCPFYPRSPRPQRAWGPVRGSLRPASQRTDRP